MADARAGRICSRAGSGGSAISRAPAMIASSFSGVQVHASGSSPPAGGGASLRAIVRSIISRNRAASKLTFVRVAKSASVMNSRASSFPPAAPLLTAMPLQRWIGMFCRPAVSGFLPQDAFRHPPGPPGRLFGTVTEQQSTHHLGWFSHEVSFVYPIISEEIPWRKSARST